MAGPSGEDRVVATAHHILRTLSSSHTDDMLRILSTFDDRFSQFSLSMAPGSAADSPSAPSDFGSQNGRDQQASPSPDDIHEDDGRGGDGVEDRPPPALQSAEEIIMRWDFGSSEVARQTFLWSDKREEVSGYLDAVDCLHTVIDSLSSSSSEASRLVDHDQNVLQFAMLRLEAEFCHVLQKHSEPADPDWMFNLVSSRSSCKGGFSISISSCRAEEDHENAIDRLHKEGHDGEAPEEGGEEEGIAKSRPISDMNIDLLPPDVVSDLYDIAMRMLRSGYHTECIHIYVGIRKKTLEESLQKLGQEKLTFEEVQKMSWELLESEIVKWIQAMKIAAGGLFPSEKQLCETVFADSPAISESCFIDVAKTALLQLLNFGEAIAIGRRAPEKLFKILDMYECLQDLLPSIESILGAGASSAGVKSEASAILTRLGDAARGTFAEFENALQRETSKNPVPGGAVHPLARYVMNYMRFLSDYTKTMNQLLWDRKDVQIGNSNHRVSDQSPLSAVTLSLMENLERNLDAKSKLYRDAALAYLFLMNNVHYIGQKVKDSEVRKLLGDEWIKRNNGKLRQYHNSYRRTAWTKVLACLKDEGINISGGSASGASRNVLKDRFKNFNAAFEENVKTQCSWIVSDSQLCTELRISITEMILPAYRSFLGRFQNHLDVVRHPEKYVKYTPDDLEAYLNDLFEGSSTTMNRRKSFPAAGSGQ